MATPGHKRKTLLVALGGNALIRKGQKGEIAQQFANLLTPMRQIARLAHDYKIIITHGNGPQVGNLLLQQECCAAAMPRLPLEILVAQTQGQLGYMIESTLDSAFMTAGISDQKLVSLISYVVVDEHDPAFGNPSKPIGPSYTREQAAAAPFPTRETAKGYRRVVASPAPLTIVEKREIKLLIDLNFIVICCGGGGIPVIREGRGFSGVDAVIDKDLASAKLAEEVGVDIFLIATDVVGAALNFDRPDRKFLSSLTLAEAAGYLTAGHFPPGSMGPKVEAAIRFIKAGGQRAIIASIEEIEEAVAGRAGTEITH